MILQIEDYFLVPTLQTHKDRSAALKTETERKEKIENEQKGNNLRINQKQKGTKEERQKKNNNYLLKKSLTKGRESVC